MIIIAIGTVAVAATAIPTKPQPSLKPSSQQAGCQGNSETSSPQSPGAFENLCRATRENHRKPKSYVPHLSKVHSPIVGPFLNVHSPIVGPFLNDSLGFGADTNGAGTLNPIP